MASFREHFVIFGKSFTHWRMTLVLVIEIVFLLLAVLYLKGLNDTVSPHVSLVSQFTSKGDDLPDALNQEVLARIQHSAYSIAGWIVLWLSLGYLTYSVSRTAQWAIVHKKKPSIRLIASFLLYTLLSGAVFLLWSYISFMTMKEVVAPFFFLLVIVPVSFYFNSILQSELARSGRFWLSIKSGFKLSILKVNRMLMPFVIIFIMLLVSLTLMAGAVVALKSFLATAAITAIVIFLLFLSWTKFYIADYMRKVQ